MNYVEKDIRINDKIIHYVECEVIPKYKVFDKGHNIDHVITVILNSLEIAKELDVNLELVYVIAAFHDLGLKYGRKDHHINSGQILLDDEFLTGYFSPDQIITMKEAVEDHRASNKHEPRSIYGKIVAEADRIIDYETILRRTVQYGLAHHSELSVDGHLKRTIQHITDKYGENGYLKLWLETRKNKENLFKIRKKLGDLESFKSDFLKIYRTEMKEV